MNILFICNQNENFFLDNFILTNNILFVMNILFVCNQNKHRSKTAELLFKSRFRTKSAGLFNETPVTEKQISWADSIVVMEDFQRTELSKRFPEQYMQKRIVSLNIPDIYQFNQPELVELLKSKVEELF